MNIDLQSRIYVENCPRSKLDLISVKNSLLPPGSFETEKNGSYYRTEIDNCSVGRNSHIAPGTKLERVIVLPMSCVVNSIIGVKSDPRCQVRSNCTSIGREAQYDLPCVVLVLSIGCCMIPAFEIWKVFFEGTSKWEQLAIFPLMFVAQIGAWMGTIVFGDLLTSSRRPEDLTVPVRTEIPAMVATLGAHVFQKWLFVYILHGTPFFAAILRFLGTSVEGRSLMFGTFIFDASYHTIKDRTVCDKVVMNGHYMVHDTITFGRTVISGILHEGTYIMANSRAMEKVAGPWRSLVPNGEPRAEITLPTGT